MKAKPSMNGNSPEHFRNVYATLSDASDAIDKAMSQMLSNVAHGRNYQHLDQREADDAVIEDRRRIQATHMALRARIGELQSEIVDVLYDIGEI